MKRLAYAIACVWLTASPSLAISVERERPSRRLIAMLPAPSGIQQNRGKQIVLPVAPLTSSFKADVVSTSTRQSPAHTQTQTAPSLPMQLLHVEDEGVTVEDALIPIPEAPSANPASSTANNVSSPLLPTNPLSNLNIPVRPKKVVRKIVINIPARQLSLYDGKTLIKTYPVGVGRAQFPTPVGRYEVIRKVLNPGWENPYMSPGKIRIQPGVENPLGTRWIGFKEDGKGEYGIHGTDDPPSVGKYSSHGCVRMYVKQAEELYNQVNVGTPVEVVYQPVVIQQKQNRLVVTVYPDALRRGLPSLKTLQLQIQQQYPTGKINYTQLQQALKLPTQKPVIIGQVPVPMPPVASETPAEKPGADKLKQNTLADTNPQ